MLPEPVLDAIASWGQLHCIEIDGITYVELDALVGDTLRFVGEQACYIISYLNAMVVCTVAACCLLVVACCKLRDFLDDRRKRKAASTAGPSSPDLP